MRPKIEVALARLVTLRADVLQLHTRMVQVAAIANGPLATNELTDSDVVDLGLLARQIEQIADDLRKEAAAKVQACSTIIGERVARLQLTDPEAKPSMRGLRGTAISRGAVAHPVLPRRRSPEDEALGRWLGLDKIEQWKRDLVKPDFKALASFVNTRLAMGHDLPPGIAKTFDRQQVTFRART